jgi:hypothetical protein
MANVVAFVLFVIAAVMEFTKSSFTPFFWVCCGFAVLSLAVWPVVQNWRPIRRG